MADVQSDLEQYAITGPNNSLKPFGHLRLVGPSPNCVLQLTSWSGAVTKLHNPYSCRQVLNVYVPGTVHHDQHKKSCCGKDASEVGCSGDCEHVATMCSAQDLKYQSINQWDLQSRLGSQM